ncbi:MAG: hypothetical protein IJZ19_02605 [Lentisphaeria bacterium]|nr:hypothetical protein [Lentisphaeria bacterium]MBQ9774928.1 hypothetical protein [Lentisphaeria bacterium]
MSDFLKNKNIRLRCKKSYPGAHTHIIIGQVVEESDRYVVIKGRTFHFSRIVDGMRNQVHAGETTVRIIPWENVEIIHWLTYEVDCNTDFGFDKNGNLILKDSKSTVIAERRDGLE